MSSPDAAAAAELAGHFDHVDANPARLSRYAVDGLRPDAVAKIEAIAEIERLQAAATDRNLAVIPHGGRTMLGLGMPPRRYDLALDLAALNQVVDYEPNDFTISVQAGMTLADLQRHLAVNGQFLPLDHPRFERATLGGLCAVGRGGLRRNSFGGPRDWLIGMRMVKADGTAIKGGGQVVKNVSGYDLPKLFAGSLGSLGVIVELTFKLRSRPAIRSSRSARPASRPRSAPPATPPRPRPFSTAASPSPPTRPPKRADSARGCSTTSRRSSCAPMASNPPPRKSWLKRSRLPATPALTGRRKRPARSSRPGRPSRIWNCKPLLITSASASACRPPTSSAPSSCYRGT